MRRGRSEGQEELSRTSPGIILMGHSRHPQQPFSVPPENKLSINMEQRPSALERTGVHIIGDGGSTRRGGTQSHEENMPQKWWPS